MCKKLLVLNPDDRMTARRALMHPWLKLSKDRLSMIALQGTFSETKDVQCQDEVAVRDDCRRLCQQPQQVLGMSTRNLSEWYWFFCFIRELQWLFP